MQKKTRAFLKWAGGKYSLVDDIAKRLDTAQALTGNRATTLVEPFVGAGSVFLNTLDHYVLNDINAILLNLP